VWIVPGGELEAAENEATENERVGFDWVSFTTDYGTSDAFVAICKGVIAGIAPRCRVLDVTHAVGAQDVRRGATVLASAVPYLPPSVHVAVVDPGVGTARRGVVVVAGASVLVGPDNGLLLPAADALGGVSACFALTEPRFRLRSVSATFHGRDVFAPAAAHLANGEQANAFGVGVDPAELVRLPAAVLRVADGVVEAEIVGVDHFGNVQLAAGPDALAALAVRPGDRVSVHCGQTSHEAVVGRTFGDVAAGGLLVHVDSAGAVAIAVNGGSAAALLGAGPGSGAGGGDEGRLVVVRRVAGGLR
jgi:hypothetical protein